MGDGPKSLQSGRKTAYLTEHKKHYRTLQSRCCGGLRLFLLAI